MQRMWTETITAQGVEGSQGERALVMDSQGNQDILRLESLLTALPHTDSLYQLCCLYLSCHILL